MGYLRATSGTRLGPCLSSAFSNYAVNTFSLQNWPVSFTCFRPTGVLLIESIALGTWKIECVINAKELFSYFTRNLKSLLCIKLLCFAHSSISRWVKRLEYEGTVVRITSNKSCKNISLAATSSKICNIEVHMILYENQSGGTL